MDANGLRFWMLSDQRHWTPVGDRPRLDYDKTRHVLRLPSQAPVAPTPFEGRGDPEAAARFRLQTIPQARDGYGTWAFWDQSKHSVMAAGAGPDSVQIYAPAIDEVPRDLALGFDGILYIGFGDKVVMQDRRGRWPATRVQAGGVQPWRLAADPAGGVWLLDREAQKLWRLQGAPRPTRGIDTDETEAFENCDDNDAPRISPAALTWPADETAVAIACSMAGTVAVLTWDSRSEARIHALTSTGKIEELVLLAGAAFPYSLAWLTDDRIAVITSTSPHEAPAYDLGYDDERDGRPRKVLQSGDYYPLRNHDGDPFLHGVGLPPHYPTRDERHSAPLRPLSMPRLARKGSATHQDTRFFDSGSAQTVWHRAYLEASIPDNGAIKLFLAATNDPDADNGGLRWSEHHFGESTAPAPSAGVPKGAWVTYPSEVPHQPGMLPCPPERHKAGLFTVLVQRTGRAVSKLQGRYLRVRIELSGDGRSTPEVAALRVYGSRFSYVENYLPEIYQESLAGDDADAVTTAAALQARSTPHDFLERFLDNLEGILTPIEDRIAYSFILTDPRSAPPEALEWLGSWIGVTFEPGYPAERRRKLLSSAPELYRKRGTLNGLRLALDIATGGACSRGEVVVVEDYRLRRTFATILGADLANEDDPLLAGLVRSGNSIVGDTLFLGDESKLEFLALFGAGAIQSSREQEAVDRFLESLAYQVTLLVHDEVDPQDFGLIQRIVELETPAHVLTRVVRSSRPLLIGVASLVGVDTYLVDKPQPQPVRIDSSYLGVRDVLVRPPSLDPRVEGGLAQSTATAELRPRADAGPDALVPQDEPFTLDASGSEPGSGGPIERYNWTLLNS